MAEVFASSVVVSLAGARTAISAGIGPIETKSDGLRRARQPAGQHYLRKAHLPLGGEATPLEL
jgi:hypothetical protein